MPAKQNSKEKKKKKTTITQKDLRWLIGLVQTGIVLGEIEIEIEIGTRVLIPTGLIGRGTQPESH
jgi:hypothetical protein